MVDSLDIPPKSPILMPEWLWFSMDSSSYHWMGVAYQLCYTAEATDNMGPHIKSIQSRNNVWQFRQVKPSIPSLARLDLSKEEQALLYMLDVIPRKRVDAILQTDTQGKDGYMNRFCRYCEGSATCPKQGQATSLSSGEKYTQRKQRTSMT